MTMSSSFEIFTLCAEYFFFSSRFEVLAKLLRAQILLPSHPGRHCWSCSCYYVDVTYLCFSSLYDKNLAREFCRNISGNDRNCGYAWTCKKCYIDFPTARKKRNVSNFCGLKLQIFQIKKFLFAYLTYIYPLLECDGVIDNGDLKTHNESVVEDFYFEIEER